MSDCLFCRISNGQIPAKIVYQDDKAMAFEDIHPEAPIHVIIIPKKHIPTVLDITDEDQDIMGYLYLVAKKIAINKSLTKDGFRLVVNCGKSGGQEILHIHINMLGGRLFSWPPG
jgi:histidine triad (HIT) family protein